MVEIAREEAKNIVENNTNLAKKMLAVENVVTHME
jgi:hypothetical protein